MTCAGRSRNGRTIEGSSVGVISYGEKGSLLRERDNAYTVYDLDNKVVKEVKSNVVIDTRNLVSLAQALDALHIQNFFDGIRKGTAVHSDIVSGHKSTLLVQLGNVALRAGCTLDVDPKNGHIINNTEASKYWRREYQPGWEPKV